MEKNHKKEIILKKKVKNLPSLEMKAQSSPFQDLHQKNWGKKKPIQQNQGAKQHAKQNNKQGGATRAKKLP